MNEYFEVCYDSVRHLVQNYCYNTTIGFFLEATCTVSDIISLVPHNTFWPFGNLNYIARYCMPFVV